MNLTIGSIALNETTFVHITSSGSSRIEPSVVQEVPLFVYEQDEDPSDDPYLALSNIELSGFQSVGVRGSVVHFSGRGTLQITNVSFTHNWAESGGAMYVANNDGGVRIENSTFVNSTAAYGGAVTFSQHVVNASITGSSFTACRAHKHGGCIFVDTENSAISIFGCQFTDSIAVGGVGGAVALDDRNQDIRIASSSFSGTSADHGGGVSVGTGNSNVSLSGLSFQHCTSQRGGGAIALNTSNHHLTIAGCTIRDCHVLKDDGDGGGIYAHADNQHLLVTDTSISDSSAYIGGGISIEHGNTHSRIQAVRLLNCSAQISGGGIFSFGNKNLTIVDTEVGYCAAYKGGGIHLEHDNDYALLQRLAVHDCNAAYGGGGISLGSDNTWVRLLELRVANCFGFLLGGGIYAESQNNYLMVDRSVIEECRSQQGGGLLLGRNEGFGMTNSVLRGCQAYWGGAVMLYSSNVLMTFVNVTMDGNRARDDGGAIYSTQYSKGLRIGGCTFRDNHALAGQGGALYVESGNDLVLISDAEAVRETLAFESEHPYAYAPVIFRQQVSIPGAVGYLLIFDPQCSIGTEDKITVCTTATADCSVPNASKLFQVKGDGDWPGVTVTPLQVDLPVFTLEMTGSSSKHAPETSKDDNYFGFRAAVVPIFPPDKVKPTIFSHNTAGTGGGAVGVFSSVRFAMFLNCQFVGNQAGSKGGALFLRNALAGLTMRALSFSNNRAGTYGGAVCASSASFGWDVRDCRFDQNVAADGGGGLAFITDNGAAGILTYGNEIEFKACGFSNNSAAYGGGIYFSQENEVQFYQTQISGNNASIDGGGIYMRSGNVITLWSCRVTQNSAGLCGGGASLIEEDQIRLYGSQVLYNTAGM